MTLMASNLAGLEQVGYFFRHLLDPAGFPARWWCGQWTAFHGWFYILADLAIWGAYTSIPLILVYFFYRNQKKFPYPWILLLFASFIHACGTTHLIDAVIFWHPVYRFSALVRGFTAVISWATVIALINIIPKALTLKGPKELERLVEERTTQLQETEARFLATFEQAAVGIAHLTPDGKWNRLNQKFCDILGYDYEELQGLRFQDVTYPEDLAVDEELAQKVLRGEIDSYNLEKRYIRKDGSLIWVELTVSLIRDANQAPVYFVAVVQDISERKQAEEALKKSEERYSLAIEGTSEGIWDLELDSGKRYWSQRMREILGLSDSTVEPDAGTLQKIVHPEDFERIKAGLVAHLQVGEPFEESFRFYRPDGEMRYGITRGKAVRDAAGKPYRMAGSMADITDRKLAEQAIYENYQREHLTRRIVEVISQTFDLNTILQSSAEMLVQYFKADRCFMVVFGLEPITAASGRLGQQARRHPGITWLAESDLPNSSHFIRLFKQACHDPKYPSLLWQADSPGDFPAFYRPYAEKYQVQSVLVFDITYREQSYGRLVLHQCDAPRTWQPRELDLLQDIVTYLGIAIYQTGLLEEEREAKEQAEVANQRKSQFLANMSHELRTPLNAVIGYSEMMEKGITGDLNDKQQKYVSNILMSGRHLLDMVNDLLDLSKIEAGHVELRIEYVILKDLVADLMNAISLMARNKGVRLEVSIVPNLEGLYCDRTRLYQILLNLMVNAVKFNRPEGGWVHLTIERIEAEQAVAFAVQDNGIGIPENKLGELFTEFYQVDSSYSRQQGGTGLGLALTRHLAELHGGTISVESREGVGSTFTVVLPERPEINIIRQNPASKPVAP